MSCARFLKGKDELGAGVAINHKGEAGFGTVLGGVLSFTLSLFMFVFVCIQLFGFF